MSETAPGIEPENIEAPQRNKGGRPKGSLNKFTTNAKQAFQTAFEELGGVEGLVAWAQKDEGKNLGDFYKLFARLIPTDVKVEAPQLDDLKPSDPMELARRMLFLMQLGVKQSEQSERPTATH